MNVRIAAKFPRVRPSHVRHVRRRSWVRGHFNLVDIVHVIEPLRCDERKVRFVEANGEDPWFLRRRQHPEVVHCEISDSLVSEIRGLHVVERTCGTV